MRGAARRRIHRGVHRLEHLRQDLRIPVEREHDPVDDPRHVVEVHVEIRFGEHAADAQLHLADPDVHARGDLHEVHRVRVERDVRAHVLHREPDGVHGQLRDLEDHVAVRGQARVGRRRDALPGGTPGLGGVALGLGQRRQQQGAERHESHET
ncbi:MAG TPA: hypothetical protein VFN38_11730, partial [Gemmatimonadaceae bacterium]|nr:hypothetical protein [Gemmatimonadaceae bacterium]